MPGDFFCPFSRHNAISSPSISGHTKLSLSYSKATQRICGQRSSLDDDVAELKELAEVFEPERMIICQRSGPGKGCTMTWAEKDKVFVSIKYSGTVAAVVREIKDGRVDAKGEGKDRRACSLQ
jgi:hypothetical protein